MGFENKWCEHYPLPRKGWEKLPASLLHTQRSLQAVNSSSLCRSQELALYQALWVKDPFFFFFKSFKVLENFPPNKRILLTHKFILKSVLIKFHWNSATCTRLCIIYYCFHRAEGSNCNRGGQTTFKSIFPFTENMSLGQMNSLHFVSNRQAIFQRVTKSYHPAS